MYVFDTGSTPPLGGTLAGPIRRGLVQYLPWQPGDGTDGPHRGNDGAAGQTHSE